MTLTRSKVIPKVSLQLIASLNCPTVICSARFSMLMFNKSAISRKCGRRLLSYDVIAPCPPTRSFSYEKLRKYASKSRRELDGAAPLFFSYLPSPEKPRGGHHPSTGRLMLTISVCGEQTQTGIDNIIVMQSSSPSSLC